MPKTCPKCKESKTTDMFYSDKRNCDGLTSYCSSCMNANSKNWQRKNKEHVKKVAKQWRENNSQYMKEWNSEYYKKNKKRISEYSAEYKKANLASHAKKEAKRRASKLRASPTWLTIDDDFMFNEIYQMRKIRTADTGVEHHVDHIIPLQGRNVCGLHVWCNLQLLPASENIRKSNKLEAM